MPVKKTSVIAKSAIRYCGTGLPTKPISAGEFLVHNHVTPTNKLGMRGFRAWVQKSRSGLVRCHCDFGQCENAELHKHYRVRALVPPLLKKTSAAKKRAAKP
jgi:hypothetical protein